MVFFISCWLQAASAVYWTVSNKPVIYGDDIILTCKTGHVLTDRVECPVRQWYSGHKDKLLLYNKVSRDVTKYQDRTNLSSTEFSLVIKSYTESNLNINYTCSCGLKFYTKLLGLNDEDFIVPPFRVDTHIQQSNETFSIYLNVRRVYPCPECSIVIGERTDNLTITCVKRGVFYNATYEANFSIAADDCGKKPTLLCFIGNEYDIVNTSGESIRNCTEVNGDGGSTPLTKYYSADMIKYTLVCVGILVFLNGILFYIRRRCRSIASDGDHTNIILAMKSKIRKQTDSGVDLNDERCSLQSH